MSKPKERNPKHVEAVFCRNPFCSRGVHKSFGTESAFQKHLAMLPQCKTFLMNQHTGQGSHHHTILATKQTPSFPNKVIIATSNKRKCLLRRDVVNDTHPEFLLNTTVLVVPEHTITEASEPATVDCEIGEVSSDNDSFDNDANGCWEDICLVAQGPSVALTHHSFLHTTDQKWTVDLLKVLDNINAPDYAFGDILAWARGANAANYSFNPVGGLSRSKNIDVLFDSMPNARQLLPSIVPVLCAEGLASDVVVFDFVPQLLSLLQNPQIMRQENLIIDVNCPLQPYANPGQVLGEALSGSVYAAAYARYITKPNRQLFVPIIQWIDRTSVTGNARFSLKPYMFTPAIFTESF